MNQKQYEKDGQSLILGFTGMGIILLFALILVLSVLSARGTTSGQDVKNALVFTEKANDDVRITFSLPGDDKDAIVTVHYPGEFFVLTRTYDKPLDFSLFSDSSRNQVGVIFQGKGEKKISIEGYDYYMGKYPLYVDILQFKDGRLVREYTFLYQPARLAFGKDPLRVLYAKEFEKR